MNGVSLRRMKANKLAVVYIFFVALSFFSFLYGWFPVLHSFLYVTIIACLISFVISSDYFKSKQALIIYFYMAVVYINANNGDEFAYGKRLLDGFSMLMATSIGYYLMTRNDIRTKKGIVLMVSLVLIIQTITSLPIYMTNQGALRELIILQYRGDSDSDWEGLYRLGVLSYDVIHALPIMIPPLVMWLRNNNIKRGWKIFLTCTLVCVTILSFIYEATTVQLLVVFTLVASFLIHKTDRKKSNSRIIALIVVMLPLIVSDQVQIGVLQTIENVTVGELSKKAGDIKHDMIHKSQTSDVSVRSDLYQRSLDEFVKSPLVGTNTFDNLGNHSAVLDRMGAFGLVGIIPYVLLIFVAVYYYYSILPPDINKWYYALCTFSFIMVLVLKDMNKLEVWLMMCVVAPSLLSLPSKEISSNRS